MTHRDSSVPTTGHLYDWLPRRERAVAQQYVRERLSGGEWDGPSGYWDQPQRMALLEAGRPVLMAVGDRPD